MPGVDLARARKQRLEMCVCALLAEETMDRLLVLGKMRFHKANGEGAT